MPIKYKQIQGEGHLAIEDEMTIYTAAEQKSTLLGHFTENDAIEIDLSAVSEIDSAGVQLLMLLKNEASKSDKQVRYTHHSQSVVAVLELLDLATQFGDPVVIPTEW